MNEPTQKETQNDFWYQTLTQRNVRRDKMNEKLVRWDKYLRLEAINVDSILEQYGTERFYVIS